MVEQVLLPKEADSRAQLRRAIWHFLANRGVLIHIDGVGQLMKTLAA